MAVSTGTGEGDFDKLGEVIAAVPQLQYICVDVANGYSEHFVHFVKDVRQKYPTHTIMVSDSSTLSYLLGELLLGLLECFYSDDIDDSWYVSNQTFPEGSCQSSALRVSIEAI